MKKFAEYSSLDLSEVNKKMLLRWKEKDIFHKSIQIREGEPTFVFYEGPPSANGMPGIHHVMSRTIKDLFCRYKTMQGFQVKRKAGWDTHGLPVELSVEKSLGITKEDIGKKISIEEYNAACRRDVMKYTREWEDLTTKMGYWIDLDDPYITYDNRYIETLWWLLKQLYDKKLLYKGYTIQPYSPAAGTGLSTHELNQPGCYRDVKDTTCVAQFKVKDTSSLPFKTKINGDCYFLAWTTTPWTLPSNTALCVGPNITYVLVKTFNPYTGKPIKVILAKDLVNTYFNQKNENLPFENYQPGDKNIPYRILDEFKGSELVGIRYEQIIPWVNPGENAFRVIAGDFVSTEEGTGIVHIAPTFGADDDRVAKQNNIPPMLLLDKDGNKQPMVDRTGKFFKLEDLDPEFVSKNVNISLYREYAGRYVKNEYISAFEPENQSDKNSSGEKTEDSTLDIDLCVMLKQRGLVFKIEKYTHSYPHCWRTDKPVLYYPLDSWFIKTTALRDEMIALNQTINWKPASTGYGRFGKWLENLQDWNLSRSRFWGTPLPIWHTEDGSEEICIGSVDELISEIEKSIQAGFMTSNPYKNFKSGDYSRENYAVQNIDLHRPYVDNIVLVSKSGKPMRREPDLIDVWFDSGSMPFAQLHYPFENREAIDQHTFYPADFISEGVDQTRGWFFTLHAISTMVKGSVAYKNVVSNGLVLDKNGNKMSKRLGNVVDPFETIEKYGSDPLRWYMMTNSAPWDNLKFDIEGVEEVRRKFFGTLYNTYSFFALYANVDEFTCSEPEIPVENRPEIDRWIISLLNTLIKEVGEYYEDYDPTRAGRAISDFVTENLSNWYVRLNRKRFWGGEYNKDKISAYQTLYTCLETVAKLMAPIAPFYADQLFLDLNEVTEKNNCESVHLSNFPVYDEKLIDKNLEECMQLAQQISSMILSLRRKAGKKVRQPLSKAIVPAADDKIYQQISYVADLIKAEVNIKELQVIPANMEMANLTKKVKLNFKVLGKKYGKQMKEIAEATAKLSNKEIAELEQNGIYILNLPGGEVQLTTDDVEIITEDMPGWLTANEGKLTVALDITVTDELLKEGIARELVNRIQNIRKQNGYEITDRITVEIEKRDEINDAVTEFSNYISSQTLAAGISLVDKLEDGIELDFDEYMVKVKVEKTR
ncbi:MAG: isoleucine--tRNA ligase [Paludibacteraceae bacterium]|nr:isoleucine--tRNA ligase [Paludibacteraceae bacterium]MBP8966055.1 isoleucine--tRNA ligase [Paludibacteraceae bacterium]HOF98537.1 isoleucine--tRNA ligase [Paludibacteraceae bacterium]HOR39061.1 isoleucine--tRNA ligase [Paludibacteraceae bacterium]HPL76461.1 isoleucine--tRNA ligase [Paludibacteraceae bacterium]